jgi:hypothetical protein
MEERKQQHYKMGYLTIVHDLNELPGKSKM